MKPEIYRIIFFFFFLIVGLLSARHCTDSRAIADLEQTIAQMDSINRLLPDTILKTDTLFIEKKTSIKTVPVRNNHIYKDSIFDKNIEIIITDTLQSDSSINRKLDYTIKYPTITESRIITQKVPVIVPAKEKRFFISAGIGSDIKFSSPAASLQFGYTAPKWLISGEYFYFKQHGFKINAGVRF